MAKISQNKIINVLTEDWGKDSRNGLPYSGKAVREALQSILKEHDKKVGYYKWSPTIDSSNYYHLWGFRNEADYKAYAAGDKEDASIKALLLVDEALPINTVQGDSYGAYLFSTIGTTNNIVVSGDSLEVSLRFHAVRNSNGDRLNVGSNGTLVIQRKTSTSSWATVGTMEDVLPSTDYSDDKTYTKVDIGKYLQDGAQQVRLQGRYTYTDGEGKEQSQASTYVLVGASVTKTAVTLSCRQDWHTPILASVQHSNGFPYSYVVNGAVQKTLHIEITGGNKKTLPIEIQLSSEESGTVVRNTYKDVTDTYKLWQHGVRLVKAWITYDDGLGNTLSSDVLENRFMVVNPTTSAEKTKPYIMIQDMMRTVVNYTQCNVCSFAVYSPRVNEDGSITNDGGNINTIFYLTSYAETFPAANCEEYFRIEESVEPGIQKTLNTTIEIEGDDAGDKIQAYFRVFRKEGEKEVDFLTDSVGTDNISVSVDNSDSYAPTSGATFLVNPKVRNNAEENPQTIQNARANNVIVDSKWEGFGMVNDGWVTDDDGVKVLRVPSGAKLTIGYNPFAQFVTTPDSAMTFEMDIAVRNVTNEADPILQICEAVADSFIGLRVKPMVGYMYSASDTTESEIDFHWQEGKRTHITVNIHNAVIPNKGDALTPSGTSLNTAATKAAFIRVFMNGNIEREIKFSTTNREEFCTGAMSNGGIIIGQDGADIDIYSLRCYTNMQLESADIMKDYISTLPTSEEKIAKRKANDIMTGEKVDIEKVKALGKRILVLHGEEPYIYNTGSQKVWWEIFQYNADGSYNPDLSGTICKETKMDSKRQGSTANTYYYSNIQTKISDAGKIIVALVDIHRSITWSIDDPVVDESTGETTRTVSIYGGNLGKLDPVKNQAVKYPYKEVNGVPSVEVPDGWIDGNGKYRGMGYMIAENTPLAIKVVDKINYASSMQSHLCGCNRLFNDLHDLVVGKNDLQAACPTARVSKYTEPVFFFTQSEGGKPVFRGGGNFGAGKMDKPTWGYVKKLYPNFAMFEGSDNNYELTDMRVPFSTDNGNPECITYSHDDEGYFYNGLQNIDFDAGMTDTDENGNETPVASLTNRLAEVWNFLYLHAPRIEYYNGTFADFQTSQAASNTQKKYWCTQGDDAYLLKRYNFVTKKWVDAGLWNGRGYAVIDLRTDEMTRDTYNSSENQAQFAALNKEFIAAVVAHFKTYVGWYIDVKSLLFHYALINHFIAGTDNCSKNTYYVFGTTRDVTINGITKTVTLMELHQDDVDTILATDNNGRSTKKYYVDRMHPYSEEDQTTSQYEGMNNVLFNLCEEAYESTRELQSMLKSILTAMTKLVSNSDKIEGFTDSVKVSVWGCLWKYLFSINSYFPAMAFNEQARIRYEYPAMLGFISTGSGARGVAPITQSCGSSLEMEQQYMKRRLIYMASYAAWGNLYDGGKSENIGLQDVTDTFAMQAYHLPDSATSATEYKFNVKPHQYIYPTGMMGQTSVDPHIRVAPGQEYELNLGTTTSNDTGLSILGINYYRSIGNIGDLSTSPNLSVTINGKRLTEIIAEPTKLYTDTETGKKVPAFRPNNIVVSALQVQKLSLKGCSGIGGSLNVTNLVRLHTINVSDTAIYDVRLPKSKVLTSIAFPANLSKLSLVELPVLKTVSLQGASQLVSVECDDATLGISTENLVTSIYEYKQESNVVELSTVKLSGVNYRSMRADVFRYLNAVKSSVISGKIALVDGVAGLLTFSNVFNLIEKYGDIQSINNSLYLSYPKRTINKVNVNGDKYIKQTGVWTGWNLTVLPSSGNNIAVKDNRPAVNYRFVGDNAEQAGQYAEFVDDVKGVLNVKKLSEASQDLRFQIEVRVGLTDGTELTYTKGVGFYNRIPRVGDFAYSDGSFDDELDTSKTCVGVVFKSDKLSESKLLLRVYAAENVNYVSDDKTISQTTIQWGIYPNDNNLNNSLGEAVLNEINTAVGVGDICDIADLPNKEVRELYEPNTDGELVKTDKITVASYQNSTTEDGYKVFGARSALNDFDGKSNTKSIVNWANSIISLYLNESYPKTLQELSNRIAALVKKKADEGATYPNTWKQVYYPAAYGCYLYEPSISGTATLNEQYKKGNWYLPSEGELARVYNFFGNSRGWQNNTAASIDYANERPESEATTPIFANLLKRAQDKSAYCPVAMMLKSMYYWTSTEASSSNVWYVNSGNGNTDFYGKANSFVVRAAVAFTFSL